MGTLTKEGQEARLQYQRKYRANLTVEQREKYRKYQKEYQKKYQRTHPEKVKEARIRYWNRKGQAAAAEE